MDECWACVDDGEVIIRIIKCIHISIPIGYAIDVWSPQIRRTQIHRKHRAYILSLIDSTKNNLGILRKQLCETKTDNRIINLLLIIQTLHQTFHIWIIWVAGRYSEDTLKEKAINFCDCEEVEVFGAGVVLEIFINTIKTHHVFHLLSP